MIDEKLNESIKSYNVVKTELECAKKNCRNRCYQKIECLVDRYIHTKLKYKRKKIEEEISKIQKELSLYY